MYKRLLTIQDISCVGQCSATVALPVVSACGVECAVLPSAVLSNHTGGFKSWTFCDLTGEIAKCAAKWQELGISFDAFYTGYICQHQIDPILDLVKTCAAPNALRIVDPVLGDNGKMYAGFADDFPSQMARLCNGADYILPNLTEAAFLLSETPRLENHDRAFIEKTVAGLHKLGAKNVILTGVSFAPDQLGTAISDGHTVAYDFNPRLSRHAQETSGVFAPSAFHGTGDLFASVFAGAILRGKSTFDAAALAADIVCAAIKETPDDHWYGVAFERALPELVRAF